MEVAIILFGLLVGIMQLQDPGPLETEQQLAQVDVVAAAQDAAAEPVAAYRVTAQTGNSRTAGSHSPLVVLAQAGSKAELTQFVADLVAGYPASAGNIVTIALAQKHSENTIGDVSLLAAAATKAAPQMAPQIAAAIARSVGESAAALAAATASIIALAPEQAQAVAAAVGAEVGNNPFTLGMIAQTVAIAVGVETFTGLSASSGVSIAALMKESSRLGVKVPFEVPNYAAQTAPRASMVANTAN